VAKEGTYWQRLRMSAKIGGGFALVLVLVVVVAVLGLYAVRELTGVFTGFWRPTSRRPLRRGGWTC